MTRPNFQLFSPAIVFDPQFLSVLPSYHKGDGSLEKIAQTLELLCRLSTKVLRVGGLSLRDRLVYTEEEKPFSMMEIVAKLLICILVLPLIILLVLKLICRVGLYLRYRGWEVFSDDAILRSPISKVALWKSGSYEVVPRIEYSYSVQEIEGLSLTIPPLDSATNKRILAIHSLIRSGASIKELESWRFTVCNKGLHRDLISNTEEVVFTHPAFPHYKFVSVVSQKLGEVTVDAIEVAKSQDQAFKDSERSRLLLVAQQLSKKEKRSFLIYSSRYFEAPVKGFPEGMFALIIKETQVGVLS